MPKPIKIAALTCLLALLPVMGYAQTCKPGITPTTPTSRFTDHHDGTVTDTQTGLMWKRCSEGQTRNSATNGCDGRGSAYTWKAAQERAQAVNAGEGEPLGHDDWRVPDINELRSIIEKQCSEPAINLTVFPATQSAWFWSSSPYASNPDGAWYVVFYGGYDDWNVKGILGQVRLVRGTHG